jgi:nucleotidyltransferase AbiEii toxin of type IV toxin-antitoxin system
MEPALKERWSPAPHEGTSPGVSSAFSRVEKCALLGSNPVSRSEPTVELRSYLSRFLNETGFSLGADDEGSFSMRLLHFRRTFVGKMFAIHKVELLKRDRQPIGTYARHYYDLHQLAGRDEVRAMLASDEYAAIKADYGRISRAHFSRSCFYPDAMRFARSDALFPPAELSATISAVYEGQCRLLCYGPYPAWAEMKARLEELRHLL